MIENDLKQRIKDLEQQIEKLTTWYPMKDAPRNGTTILLDGPFGVRTARWFESHWNKEEQSYSGRWGPDEFTIYENPTRWRHTPESSHE